MDYRALDELDVRVEGSSPPPSHQKLIKANSMFEYWIAMDEWNYRLYYHDFFPRGKKKRRW